MLSEYRRKGQFCRRVIRMRCLPFETLLCPVLAGNSNSACIHSRVLLRDFLTTQSLDQFLQYTILRRRFKGLIFSYSLKSIICCYFAQSRNTPLFGAQISWHFYCIAQVATFCWLPTMEDCDLSETYSWHCKYAVQAFHYDRLLSSMKCSI